MVFAKMRRPSETPSARTVEVLFEEDDVGCVLGHVGGCVDGDADVGVVEGERVVDAVAEERHRRPRNALGPHDAGLLLGTDPGEDRGLVDRVGEFGVVEPVEVGAGERPARADPERVAHRLGDERVVAGDDLDGDAQLGQPGDGVGSRGLGLVEEHQEPGQAQVVPVVGADVAELAGVAAGDGDHPVAPVELGREHAAGFLGDVDAAVDDGLGGALGDEESIAIAIDQHGDTTAVVVEGEGGDAVELGGRRRSRNGGPPQGDVEGVARHCCAAAQGGLVACQPEGELVSADGAGGVDGTVEADVPVGERAGLVGEQHVDVAEVLDAHEPFDQHLLRSEPA